MFLVSPCCCLCPTHWSHVLSWEWRCSWSSADRRCSNYIWVINNFIAYQGAYYTGDFMVDFGDLPKHAPRKHCNLLSSYVLENVNLVPIRGSILVVTVTAALQVPSKSRSPSDIAMTKKKTNTCCSNYLWLSIILFDRCEPDHAMHNTRRNLTKCHGTSNVHFFLLCSWHRPLIDSNTSVAHRTKTNIGHIRHRDLSDIDFSKYQPGCRCGSDTY